MLYNIWHKRKITFLGSKIRRHCLWLMKRRVDGVLIGEGLVDSMPMINENNLGTDSSLQFYYYYFCLSSLLLWPVSEGTTKNDMDFTAPAVALDVQDRLGSDRCVYYKCSVDGSKSAFCPHPSVQCRSRLSPSIFDLIVPLRWFQAVTHSHYKRCRWLVWSDRYPSDQFELRSKSGGLWIVVRGKWRVCKFIIIIIIIILLVYSSVEKCLGICDW